MLFGVFFVELGAADDGIGFRRFRSLFLLSFDEARGQGGDLIFVQFSVIARGFHVSSSRLLRRLDEGAVWNGSLTGSTSSFSRGGCFCFSAGISQEPAR